MFENAQHLVSTRLAPHLLLLRFDAVLIERVLCDLLENAAKYRPLGSKVFDLGLPDGDGIDFLKDLRKWSNVPVIVLSARIHEADKIDALDAGAGRERPLPAHLHGPLAPQAGGRSGAAALSDYGNCGRIPVDVARVGP